MRLGIGLTARGVFWLCLWFIVANAVAQAIADGQWVIALFAAGLIPLTFVAYPFIGPGAWPFTTSGALFVALGAALIAYPISTLVGGLDPVD